MNQLEKQSQNILRNTKGQTLVEFILLFSIVSLLALTLMKVTSFNVGKRWQKLVKIIAAPTTTTIELSSGR